MIRYFLVGAAAACVLAGSARAQNSNPLIAEAKQGYTGVKNNLVRMAEKMPEEHYSFQPTPDIRTFGQLVAHVADSQTRACSAVKGEQKQPNAASKTSKTDLEAAIKESFAYCDSAFDSITDATAVEVLAGPRGKRSKLGMLVGMTSHSNEEYGYMAVYMRLKGLVPPSSEKR